MATDADGYESFYTDKLWRLLPEVYRAEDSADPDQAGPLRELVERIGAQAAIVRRSIDRTWDDQAVETCDDWLLPYLGELLATNLVASVDARGQRLDVFKTIYYRRRAGTLAVLEELAADITGWNAKVVEFFRRLGRARHGLDPELGPKSATLDPSAALALQRAERIVGRLTGTPAGGFADLRNTHGSQLTGTAFDEYAHSADVRRGRGAGGWHNISHLGVFVYRLESIGIEAATPVRDAACPDQYTFDPSGRDVPLFAAATRSYGDDWISPTEHQLPGPISAGLLADALPQLYAALDPLDGTTLTRNSLALYEVNGPLLDLVEVSRIVARPREFDASGNRYLIDAQRGRFFVPASASAFARRVSYRFGFASEIGAGSFERRTSLASSTNGAVMTSVHGGGAALASQLTSNAALRIEDSLTYDSAPALSIGTLLLTAANKTRPLLRLPASSPGPTDWVLSGDPSANDDRGGRLVIDGLWIAGGRLVLRGDFDVVSLRTVTLDPGEPNDDFSGYRQAADARELAPTALIVDGSVRKLEIDRCVLGPILLQPGASVELVSLRDCIVQEPLAGGSAIDIATGRVELERCSVLGHLRARELEASACILHQPAVAADLQEGCVRFTAYAAGSVLPCRYESVEIASRAPLFTSLRFSQPGFAQLAGNAPVEVSAGAPDGSEMGAFCRQKNAIKERSLLIKFRQYAPIGITPVIIYAT